MTTPVATVAAPPARSTRVLDAFERFGNRCPDPVVLFLAALALTWLISSLLAGHDFGLTDPRSSAPLVIRNQLTLQAQAQFLAGLTTAFVTFAPLGMVLVMAIGVGIAERSGLVGAALRGVLAIAPARLLTPLVAVASVVAHVLSDSATVILLPLAGALFFVAGRHPLAGIVAGTLRSHRDVVEGMAVTMASLGYYIVMVFFAAVFTKAFADSNLGALMAIKGAETLRALALPGAVTLVGVVILTAGLDVLVPSASAKWALVAPILVPMLLAVGIAPELIQAAFRVGDGPVNLVTPLMPHFRWCWRLVGAT